MESSIRLDARELELYLRRRLGDDVRVVGVSPLTAKGGAADVKAYGYGEPIRIDYRRDQGGVRSAVLETIAPGPFGHEGMADRAQIALWSHHAYNRLPRHVPSLDVGGFLKDGKLLSFGCVDEFFVLNEFVEGCGYNRDLERLRDGQALRPVDVDRADALCDYLVAIHSLRHPDPQMYIRRLRELVGHHECIMGILDAYPPSTPGADARALEAIEHACIDWRWRLKRCAHRLRQVHGDFHPWNILFRDAADFTVLDRSRGEWGDPADDVAALTINYIFFSLQRSERLEGAFERLFTRFWTRYVESTHDEELGDVAPPFFAFRALVVANPIWYPNLPPAVRRKLLNFVKTVLGVPRFDPEAVNSYCG